MENRHASEEALLKGLTMPQVAVNNIERCPYSPVLIIVPPSVIENWSKEFDQWGYFSVEVFGKDNDDRAASLNRVKEGIKDVLITGKTLFKTPTCFRLFMEIEWKIVVIDEFHEYKNHKSKGYECLEKVRNQFSCPLIGLTGTLMQNEHRVSVYDVIIFSRLYFISIGK